MIYFVFVLLIAVLGIAIYLTVVLGAVPGAVDERLGQLEALPENLGEWVADPEPSIDGELRETRVLLGPQGFFGRETLIRQTRYRDSATQKIVRVDPEQRWTRRRRKA